MQQVIRTVKRRLPPGYYDLEDETNDDLEDEDGRPKYKIGHVPPKTTDMNKQVR